MLEREYVVNNEVGLHARPAALFVQCTNKFLSDIYIQKGNKRVDGKSIMGVMSLGIGQGENIKIIADGPDENQAIEAIERLIHERFLDM
ncbi:phosphocarrier protein [Peptoclostridium litorale DSM 5388]|uniref:Phosphocarrier protein HPr n=1 Tax=Peptoclostridium litorale DSM 5388 TaxID=1121324 RepID=A0A069RCX6_PEPLI|nr:HPr family phosphocarrier protein [Peptoclostridium litorale]KDR94881.1 phosphocarrier protein HPr [Peptoclostridium litorale DSM 5388]SIN94786.1 phosphocarrier protein [Peptoclostridium litorale DSM 5388]